MTGFTTDDKSEDETQPERQAPMIYPPDGPQLHQATARIAEALTEMVTSAATDMQAQVVDDRAKFAALEDRQRRYEAVVQVLLQRLDAQERAVESLREDFGRRRGLLERIVGTLRSLDLRSEPRTPTEKSVRIAVVGKQDSVTAGCVVDAAETGLGLMLEKPVPVGSEVRLNINGTVLSGKVAHCRTEGDGYAAGLSSVRKVEAPEKTEG